MLGAARHGQTHWLSDPEGFWYLKFKDVLGRSYLERHIEVIKGRPIKGEPALLKTRTIYHHFDDAREFGKDFNAKVGGSRQPKRIYPQSFGEAGCALRRRVIERSVE